MNKPPNQDNNEITLDFIEILRTEGNKALAICTKLNADKKYTKAIATITDEEFKNLKYKAEHLLLRDLVQVFNLFTAFYGDAKRTPIKIKFTLIYLYEKLRGKDLSKSFNLKKINTLPFSKHFDSNVATIRETSFFQPLESLKSESLKGR